jgi:hypothetical protein
MGETFNEKSSTAPVGVLEPMPRPGKFSGDGPIEYQNRTSDPPSDVMLPKTTPVPLGYPGHFGAGSISTS